MNKSEAITRLVRLTNQLQQVVTHVKAIPVHHGQLDAEISHLEQMVRAVADELDECVDQLMADRFERYLHDRNPSETLQPAPRVGYLEKLREQEANRRRTRELSKYKDDVYRRHNLHSGAYGKLLKWCRHAACVDARQYLIAQGETV